MTLSSPQKKLIGSFFLIVLLSGILAMAIHYALSLVSLAPSLFMYLPVILVCSIILYIFYFRYLVNAVQFRGAGTTTVPTIYFMAMLAAPFPFLNAICLVTDRVVEIQSLEQWQAVENESFVRIASFYPRPNEIIDTVAYETTTDDDDFVKTNYYYTGLVPLTTQQIPAWIVFSNFETLDGNLTTRDHLEKQKSYWQQNRKIVDDYLYDSVQYFTSALPDRPIELLKSKNKAFDKIILVQSSLENPSDYRISSIWYTGVWLLILCFFLVLTAVFGHNKEIEHD